MATSRKKQKHWYLQCFCAMIFPEKGSFWTIFGFWSVPKQRRGVPPHTPFHILNLKIFAKSKTWQFLELKTRPERHFFDGVCDVFCTCLNFYTKKMQHQKTNFLLVFSFFGLPPLAPNRPFLRAIFDGICDVLCTSSTLQKRAVFLPPGGGRRQTSPYS